MTKPETIETADGETLAFHKTAGAAPGVIFCGGFKSDMTGTKATALENFCRDTGRGFIRFDYRGHGDSTGVFEDGSMSEWLADALTILDRVAEGPQIVIGSSMGGWIALLMALHRPDRVAGLIGIAAAPDFTEDLMWDAADETMKQKLERDGMIEQPSDYSDEPYRITLRMITEGRRHLMLRDTIPITCPIRLLHGMRDDDVPWETALRIADKIESEDVIVTLVKSGDHRLSGDADIERLLHTVETLARETGF